MTTIEPEIIYKFLGFNITNTIIATLLTDSIILFVIYKIHKNVKSIPGKIQSIAEMIIDYFYTTTEQIAGNRTKSIFPWFMSFFLYIFFANFLGLFPGFGSIGIFEHGHEGKTLIPILRASTSDFNTTLALAIISLVATHALSIKYNGIKDYLKRFFSFNPILLFVGLLELVSELTKVFSLSFRLFGNIFAGEVVLATISSLAAYVAPIPFLLLESIVAIVQALVFSMLTMVFMSILTSPHSEGGEH